MRFQEDNVAYLSVDGVELFGGLPGKVVDFKIKIKGKEAKIMPSKIVFWARIAEANDKFHRVDYNA